VSEGLTIITGSVGLALGVFFLFFLFRAVLRRNWLAAVAFVGLFVTQAVLQNPVPAMSAIVATIQYTFGLWILIRFGVLPMVLAICISDVIVFPVTSDFSAWYAGPAIAAVAFVLAVAGWSFKLALGGRKVWVGDFLDA
jgi:hypothetical protein